MEQSVDASTSKNKLSECKELRLLVGEIVQHHLTVGELKAFSWRLKFPEQVFKGNTPSITLLHVLEKRNFIEVWSKNPGELIEILKQTLHRDDLASQVQQWSGKSVQKSITLVRCQ